MTDANVVYREQRSQSTVNNSISYSPHPDLSPTMVQMKPRLTNDGKNLVTHEDQGMPQVYEKDEVKSSGDEGHNVSIQISEGQLGGEMDAQPH